MNGIRSLLFFPGSRPELLAKAAAADAGRVCVDLEDAVAPEDKARAREAVGMMLDSDDAPDGLVVRINHPDSAWGREDLRALGAWTGAGHAPTVMIPKTESPADVEAVTSAVRSTRIPGRRAVTRGPTRGADRPTQGLRLLPVVETARGLVAVEAIASAPGVSALLFGALDLSVDLGCALDWEALLHARSRCVVAARLAEIALIDAPFFDIGDPDGLRAEAAAARRLGFTAKAAIHPSQVDVIEEVFVPTSEEIEEARRIVEAAEREGDGVFVLDGVMVDAPMIRAARRLLDGSDA